MLSSAVAWMYAVLKTVITNHNTWPIISTNALSRVQSYFRLLVLHGHLRVMRAMNIWIRPTGVTATSGTIIDNIFTNKLSMHNHVKTRACIDDPAHHALQEFYRTTRVLYAPRPNGRGGMTRSPAPPIGLKVEEAMTSAEINAEFVCPLRTPNFLPGTHDYESKRHDLIEGVSKCMISGQEAHAKFNEFREAQGSHDEVYTDGSKMNERVGARRSSTAISRIGRQPAANCPKDCQTTAPPLQLRPQPSVWHWTITNT